VPFITFSCVQLPGVSRESISHLAIVYVDSVTFYLLPGDRVAGRGRRVAKLLPTATKIVAASDAL
jgi:hypothetical protein